MNFRKNFQERFFAFLLTGNFQIATIKIHIRVFQKPFGYKKSPYETIQYGGDTEATAAAYDVEAQSIYGKIAKKSLPERTRFYHAKIDGARMIFLYTRGTKGKASRELRQMLRYFEHTVPENAESEPLKKLHQMVDQVKRDKEVSTEFMLWAEREMLWKEAGREEERKNTEAERLRAEAACQRENAERQKAEAEHQRAEAALAEVEALKRQLKQLQVMSK